MRSRPLWPRVLLTAAAATVFASPAFAEIRAERTVPSVGSGVRFEPAAEDNLPPAGPGRAPVAPPPGTLSPALDASAECFNFETDATLNDGFRFIPPDPYCAAGPDHVINVGNVIIEWRTKAGISDVPQFQQGLQDFFATGLPGPSPSPGPGTTLGTYTFDPKVVYDQYAGRFVIITLERWDTAAGNPSNQSRILLAVSKTSNPNDGFWFDAIDSKLNISGSDTWADYPGLAVDDKAVYITGNMFQFIGTGGAFLGVRLWIINKTPTYSGPNNNISFIVRNPYATAGVATTSMPAHMFGTPPTGSGGRPMGTWLVAYSGLTDGTNEYLQFVEVTDPLQTVGGPFFTVQQLNIGNIEDATVALPDAPQLGSAYLIEVNDRRLLNAVWRNNNLYCTAEFRPVSGPDANTTTARWWRLNTTTTTALTQADAGNAGGEDLGAGTYTFFPQVMVDIDGNMALGFGASGPGIYCGAYYATRMAGDPAGTLSATAALAAGTDFYKRFFSGTRNRWGDYSGLSLCPSNEIDFWIYNEYAGTRGSAGTGSQGSEDGRWFTRVGRFHLKPYISVAITSFDVWSRDGAVRLRAEFRSNLGVEGVNVYRGGETGALAPIGSVPGSGESFEFTDRSVTPGSTYRYQIGVIDADGEFYSPIATVSVKPLAASLAQNIPNPFNPSTTIRFTVPEKGHVTLKVFDTGGRLVRTLVDETRGAGSHEARWDGRDHRGAAIGSGVYFYRFTAGKFSESRKMVLLK